MPPLSPADLETVLAAWQETTLRLEQTHKALREEVKRLTDELEIKESRIGAEKSAGRSGADGFARRPRGAEQPGAGHVIS